MITPIVLRLTMPFYPIRSTYDRRRLYPMDDPALMEDYVAALRKEIAASAADYMDCRIQAVHISGGIAGHAADEPLGVLLRDIHRWFSVAENAEITLNVHPGMVSAETLDACRRGSVTHLSVDYATGNPFESEAMQRFLPPSAMDVTSQILRGSTLSLSFDLIAGLPGQSPESLQRTLEQVCGYGASEIVLHPLFPSPGTAFAEKTAAQYAASQSPRKALPTGPAKAQLMKSAGTWLGKHGFERTDLTKKAFPTEGTSAMQAKPEAGSFEKNLPASASPIRYALPGHHSVFHRLLNQGCGLLGFGCGAITRMDKIEAENTSDLNRYIRYSPDPAKITAHVREIALS